MKNSAVFYFSPVPSHVDHETAWHGHERVGFIRTELHKGKDVTEALDAAKPDEGETVLNSVPLPDSPA